MEEITKTIITILLLCFASFAFSQSAYLMAEADLVPSKTDDANAFEPDLAKEETMAEDEGGVAPKHQEDKEQSE